MQGTVNHDGLEIEIRWRKLKVNLGALLSLTTSGLKLSKMPNLENEKPPANRAGKTKVRPEKLALISRRKICDCENLRGLIASGLVIRTRISAGVNIGVCEAERKPRAARESIVKNRDGAIRR